MFSPAKSQQRPETSWFVTELDLILLLNRSLCFRTMSRFKVSCPMSMLVTALYIARAWSSMRNDACSVARSCGERLPSAATAGTADRATTHATVQASVRNESLFIRHLLACGSVETGRRASSF